MSEFDWALGTGDIKVLPAILYVHLSKAVSRYRDLLQRSKRRGELGYVAWLARNLLELSIWAEYCSQPAQNAEEFFRDAVRDLVDLDKNVGGLAPETKRDLEKARKFVGAAKPAHKYKRVDDAAARIDAKGYAANSKILSKFVHPTAMSVLARLPDEAADMVRKQFVELGRQLAAEAQRRLESSHIGESYRKYQPTMSRMLATLPREKRPF